MVWDSQTLHWMDFPINGYVVLTATAQTTVGRSLCRSVSCNESYKRLQPGYVDKNKNCNYSFVTLGI